MQNQRITRKALILIALALFSAIYFVTSKEAAGAGDDQFQAISQILETIPSGQSALALMGQYEVKVTFESGKGTAYRASSNSIIIDSGHQPMRAALSFVHEINHVKFYHEGQRADINALSEAEYARLRVEEEAEGVVKSIEAKMELRDAGYDVAELSYPLEDSYHQAAQQARNEATARERGISQAELADIGRAAGMAAVIQGFMDGRVWTSHTLEPYADFYGKCSGKASTASQLLSPVSEIVGSITGYDLLDSVTTAISESC